MKRYYIIRSSNSSKEKEKEEGEQNEFWENAGYNEYKEKHGEHFNDKLAVWASKRMKNNQHGDAAHTWSVEDVKAAFEKLGLAKPEKVTWGDVTYAANMAYADYYGISIKTETDCVKQAYADAADPDGYPGKIYNRWLSDVMGQNIDVDWGKFM